MKNPGIDRGVCSFVCKKLHPTRRIIISIRCSECSIHMDIAYHITDACQMSKKRRSQAASSGVHCPSEVCGRKTAKQVPRGQI